MINAPSDAIKDPYVLEFLGLKEESSYSEDDLESRIIDHLQEFLMEMGTGFTQPFQERFHRCPAV